MIAATLPVLVSGTKFISTNPVSKVRCFATRLRDRDVLTPEEFRSLPHLPLRERAMVMLAGLTGLRRSEMFALRWSDLCFHTMQVGVLVEALVLSPSRLVWFAHVPTGAVHAIAEARTVA